MGWGKKLKKAVKKATRAVTKPISKAADITTGAITRGAESVVKRAGLQGTFVGDSINALARNGTLSGQLVGGAADVAGGKSAKDVGKGLMVEAARSTPTGERQYRQLVSAARKSAEAAAQLRAVEEQSALDAAMAKKKALVAEQESAKARPVSDSYLSAGGTLGGYVDEEALKKKKKLGGDK